MRKQMKLMILDGNSIVNRAFYGVRPLSAPDGTPTRYSASLRFCSVCSMSRSRRPCA